MQKDDKYDVSYDEDGTINFTYADAYVENLWKIKIGLGVIFASAFGIFLYPSDTIIIILAIFIAIVGAIIGRIIGLVSGFIVTFVILKWASNISQHIGGALAGILIYLLIYYFITDSFIRHLSKYQLHIWIVAMASLLLFYGTATSSNHIPIATQMTASTYTPVITPIRSNYATPTPIYSTSTPITSQASEIVIDGQIDDWKASKPLEITIEQTSNDPSLTIRNIFLKNTDRSMYIAMQMQARPNTHASYFADIDADNDGISDFTISYLPDKNRNPTYIHDIGICDSKIEGTYITQGNCRDFEYGNSKLDKIIELEIPFDKLPVKIKNNYNIRFRIYDNQNQKYVAITTFSSTVLPTTVQLSTGRATIRNGFTDYGNSGFSFNSASVVVWNSIQGDILASSTNPTGNSLVFFLPYDAPPYSGDQGKPLSGIIEMSQTKLEQVTECPSLGYKYHWAQAKVGTVYCVRTRDGQHFAKIKVIQTENIMVFDWVYQPDGSRYFGSETDFASTKTINVAFTPIATSSVQTTTSTSSLSLVADRKFLKQGETWDIGGGFTLTVPSIDPYANPKLIWLSLYKDGVKLEDKVLNESSTYNYKNIFRTKISLIAAGASVHGVVLTDTYIAPESIPSQTQTGTQVTPELVFKGTESYMGSDGKQYVRYKLAIENWNAFPTELFASAPDLPPCGSNKNAARTWVNIYNAKDDSYIYGFCALTSQRDLNSIWFAMVQGVNPPEGVYIILTDRRKDITYRSNVLSLSKSSAVSSVIPSTDQKTITNSIGMEFVLIPAGEFDMGSPSSEKGRYDDRESPIHRVKIAKAFYMGKHIVTQKQWLDIMETNPSYFKGDNLPVDDVEWNDVQEFIRKLNLKEGNNKYRLPSESEWEYAARAGTTTRYFFGDDESELGEYAWYKNNSEDKVHDVGLKKPNPWGLYDIYGNVWEWVQDTYHYGYVGAPTDGSAWESVDVSLRVSRGGGSNNDAGFLRSAVRTGSGPNHRAMPDNSREILSGFRLVMDL